MKKPGSGTRTKSTRRKKSPSEAKLIKLNKQAEALWRQACRIQARNRCEFCGCDEFTNGRFECHHMIRRSRSRSLKNDIRNACLLCQKCHVLFHNGHEGAGWEKFRLARPDDHDFLINGQRELCKPTICFVEQEIGKLEEWLEKHGN